MLIRGTKVELISTKGEVIVDRPDNFWLLSDDHGEMGSPCHVYICRFTLDGRPVKRACHPRDIEDFHKYHEGRRKHPKAWNPQLSLGSWTLVALISEIRYLIDRPPSSRHFFEQPVRCYVSQAQPLTYKLSMPEGCILNDHGFVEP